MNQHLQTLLDHIQRSEALSSEEKNVFLNSLKAIDKELEITAFKLDRTEKVKRTTAVLLEETIEELEKKRKAVEAHNRELEIEGTLEKVRTIAMGMKEPAHMLDVCKTISLQLQSLGVKEIRNVQTAIFYEHRGTYMNYEFYAKHDRTSITETTFTNNEIHNEFATKMLKGKGETFITHIRGDEVKDWIAYQKTTNVFIDKYLETASSLNYYWFSLGPVALGISTYHPLTEEEIGLFKRFVKVFELAYRRYLDIERAEAQVREARIEAALEKVRSRSLAMHKSGELQEVVNTVFERLKDLNLSMNSASIFIFKEGSKDWEQWVATSTTNYSSFFHIPYTELPIFRDLEDAKSQGVEFYNVRYPLQDKNRWFNYAFEHTEYSGIPDDRKRFMLESECLILSFALGKKTALQVAKYSGTFFSDDENDIVKRISKVFEQAYIRFLDLQRAEAQAREAKIEAALEKVRSRSLAMHKSEEIKEVVKTVVERIKDLDIEMNGGVSLVTFSPDSKDLLHWIWIPEQFDEPLKAHLPYFDNMMFHDCNEGREKGWELVAKVYSGEVKRSYFKHIFAHSGFSAATEELKAWVMNQEYFGFSFAIQQHSGIFLNDYTGKYFSAETNDTLIRFSKVFEQAYVRFLDLQKAEAQAREAKMEVGLERVRSRSMAMHKSDELLEAGAILFSEMQKLGIESLTAGFVLMDKEEKNGLNYAPDPYTKQIMPLPVIIPHDETIHMKQVVENWKKGSSYYVVVMDEEETIKHQTFIAERSTNFTLNAEQLIAISPARLFLHNFYFKEGYLLIVGGHRLSAEQTDIMVRFTKVFQQTYTRFLDLQKAEAQAREAEIQLALERVRARTMAMQESHELGETAALLFQQLRNLDLKFWSAGIFIWRTDDDNLVEDWMGNNTDGSPLTPILLRFKDDDKHRSIYEASLRGELMYEEVLKGEALTRHYEWFMSHPSAKHVVEQLAHYEIAPPPVQWNYAAIFKQGYLLIIAEEPEPEIRDISKLFARTFEQTYTRFLDLQRAEAQAREAKIEAALEKVRAAAMSMMKPDDLLNVCEVLFKECLKLGFGGLRNAMINIHNDEKGTFLNYDYSDEIGKSINHLTYNIHPVIEKQIRQVRSANDAFSETSFMGKDLEEWKQFRRHIGEKDDQRIDNMSALYYYFYSIGTGSIGISTFSPMNGESLELLKRFRNVFSLSYQRYLDIALAEAQAREAQIEAALERVRSRSMGMQKSEELKEVIQVVYDQFVQLGVGVEHTGFILDYRDRDDMHIWLADQHKVPSEIVIPYFDSPHWNSFLDAKEKGLDFFANQLSFEEKNKFYRDLFRLFFVPDDAQEYYFSCPGLAISTVLLDNIGLYIENFSGIPYADEENSILMRFGRVFQQSYTRFLDLQKAEAQAREAQIEAALERVRSKALAMHNTNDLSQTVSTLFKELRSLNVMPWRCGVGQINEETKTTFLTTTSNTVDGESSEVRGTLQQEGHPVLDGIFEHWKLQKEFYPVLQGDDIRRYYEIIRPQIAYPQYPLDAIQYGHFIFIREGFVFAWTENKLSEGELEIFRRFASVLSLTYRRYLDLKEAEEQHRIIQADNERKTRELEEARQLQLSMLPKELPKLPNLDIAVYMKTSSEVGGDYYDFTVDDDGTLTAAIGDATGHGMKAGTIVSMIKTLFASSGARLDVKTFFTQSSDTLKGIELGRLMMGFIMLKIRAGKVEFANAGMPPLFVYRVGSKVVEEIMIHGMPLGAMKRFPYDIHELDISSGDTILLLSDGLPELKTKANEHYGYERVKQEFMISAERSPGEIVEYLEHSASEWSNGTEPDDDLTLVVIKAR